MVVLIEFPRNLVWVPRGDDFSYFKASAPAFVPVVDCTKSPMNRSKASYAL